jgi:hypothetical protein
MSNLVRRQKSHVTTELRIPTEPQDEKRIISILHLLAEHGGNKNYNVGVDISVIQIGDTYQLAAYPGTRSPIVYISYNPVKQELATCPKHVLVRAIGNTISKVGGDSDRFEELAEKYSGPDFLARLFGLGGARSFLAGQQQLPQGKPTLHPVN